MVILILASAVYAQELINLSIDDVDLENSYINVCCKQNKERSVQINLQAKLACRGWLAVREKFLQNNESSMLFFTDDLKPIAQRNLYRIISNIMHNAGINKEHLGPEVLRQTAICNMFRNGMSLDVVQKATGISTLVNLEKYRHLAMQI